MKKLVAAVVGTVMLGSFGFGLLQTAEASTDVQYIHCHFRDSHHRGCHDCDYYGERGQHHRHDARCGYGDNCDYGRGHRW